MSRSRSTNDPWAAYRGLRWTARHGLILYPRTASPACSFRRQLIDLPSCSRSDVIFLYMGRATDFCSYDGSLPNVSPRSTPI